ncbi:MAG: hypothetical protein HPY54_15090 [Chthonomonadetes bacterium]|nr:hypothetical protein [Chthonomonadetes bacterium]
MSTRQRPITRRRRPSAPPPWREIAQVALLMLAIVAVWYLAWGRYRHQPPPKVQYHFKITPSERVQP